MSDLSPQYALRHELCHMSTFMSSLHVTRNGDTISLALKKRAGRGGGGISHIDQFNNLTHS